MWGRRIQNVKSWNKRQSREESDWTGRSGIEGAGDESWEELELVGESRFVIPWMTSGAHWRYSGNNTTHIIYLERINLTSCIQNSHVWTHQETNSPEKERNKMMNSDWWVEERSLYTWGLPCQPARQELMPCFHSDSLSSKPKTNNHTNTCSHHFWTALGNTLLVTPCFCSWTLMLALSHFNSVRSDTSRHSIPILTRLAEWWTRRTGHS